MSELLRDLHFALRMLARAPVFTATVVLLLAAGISANTLIFSFIDAVLLRRLPVKEPDTLARLVELHPKNFLTWEFPKPICENAAQLDMDFAEVICQGEAYLPLRSGSATERIRVHLVSPNFFSSLGVGAYLGRTLRDEDERRRAPVAVISYDFWQREFRGDRTVIGRKVHVGNAALTIVGVSPPQFTGFSLETSPDLRVPLSIEFVLLGPDENAKHSERGFVEIYARLRRGSDREKAGARVDTALHK